MQLDIKGDDRNTGNLDRVSGYDPDEFMVMELVGAGMDPKDATPGARIWACS